MISQPPTKLRIVSTRWLQQCAEQKALLAEWAYEVEGSDDENGGGGEEAAQPDVPLTPVKKAKSESNTTTEQQQQQQQQQQHQEQELSLKGLTFAVANYDEQYDFVSFFPSLVLR